MRKKTRPPMVEAARPVKRRARRPAVAGGHVTAFSSAALPGWGALSDASPRKTARASSKTLGSTLSSMTTARFVLWLFGVGIAATFYVGHVQATQGTFERLYRLKKTNLALLLERDRLKGELDHATGPTVIYPKAHQLGLKEGFEYGPTLTTTLN